MLNSISADAVRHASRLTAPGEVPLGRDFGTPSSAEPKHVARAQPTPIPITVSKPVWTEPATDMLGA